MKIRQLIRILKDFDDEAEVAVIAIKRDGKSRILYDNAIRVQEITNSNGDLIGPAIVINE